MELLLDATPESQDLAMMEACSDPQTQPAEGTKRSDTKHSLREEYGHCDPWELEEEIDKLLGQVQTERDRAKRRKKIALRAGIIRAGLKLEQVTQTCKDLVAQLTKAEDLKTEEVCRIEAQLRLDLWDLEILHIKKEIDWRTQKRKDLLHMESEDMAH